ncbi:DUF1345 domain-containing protein [Serinicoccus hydrothermalis]|nr:DUF1345 domain-containing protein [Serinicoccus hydrothermalis]
MLTKMRSWPWWLPESRRTVLVILLSLPVALLVRGRPRSLEEIPAHVSDSAVIFLLIYLVIYTVFTLVVLVRSSRAEMEEWARAEDRGSWAQRYVYGTAPGPGVSLFIGAAALLVTIVWMPGEVIENSAFSAGVRVLLGVSLVVVSWVAVAVSFTVAYLVEDVQSGGKALGFPGKEVQYRPLADYAYLALAVSTTFGTTDVDLRTGQVRRTATVHTVVAFVFNTVVLAVVVSLLA